MLKKIAPEMIAAGTAWVITLVLFASMRHSYGEIMEIYPERDYVALEVIMDDGSIQEYAVDYDTPIPSDASEVEFAHFMWEQDDYTQYRVSRFK